MKAIPAHRQKVDVRAKAVEGLPLVTVWCVAGHDVMVRSPEPLQTAQNRGLTSEQLREQLGRLGNTPYELGHLELAVTGNPFAPSSVLNAIRREAVEELQKLQAAPRPVTINPTPKLDAIAPAVRCADPLLHLLVRSPDQLDAAIALQPSSITLDYLELYGLRPSVDRVRDSGVQVRVASPRVLKPSEERIVHFLLKLECPILVRSSGLLFGLSQQDHPELIGDFSLNAANALTADALLAMGLARLTPTHDLNAEQIGQLARSVGGDRVEAIAYQHLPVFHMEHCVFCRFLSSGASYKDCGHPCEKHRVALRDSSGREHPVMADVGCRNTVFGAEAQEASAHLDAWRDSGIRHYRLEFVHESAAQVTQIGGLFSQTLSGRIGRNELTHRLRRIATQGTTQGSLFVPANYTALPVLN